MLRLNRRQLTGSLLAGAAAAAGEASLSAQPRAARQSGDELLAAAKRNVVSNREALAKFEIAMAVEPASSFKAF